MQCGSMDNSKHHAQAQKAQADIAKKHPTKHAHEMITAQFASLQNPPASGPTLGPMT